MYMLHLMHMVHGWDDFVWFGQSIWILGLSSALMILDKLSLAMWYIHDEKAHGHASIRGLKHDMQRTRWTKQGYANAWMSKQTQERAKKMGDEGDQKVCIHIVLV